MFCILASKILFLAYNCDWAGAGDVGADALQYLQHPGCGWSLSCDHFVLMLNVLVCFNIYCRVKCFDGKMFLLILFPIGQPGVT